MITTYRATQLPVFAIACKIESNLARKITIRASVSKCPQQGTIFSTCYSDSIATPKRRQMIMVSVGNRRLEQKRQRKWQRLSSVR
ncbi:hypothetical protein COCC4DRAFT_172524 [Bipolaris maydis ATCC 48331]|uniref:Uncharacterized protein n=2 Tax=Cochliobolus heterostrophus TaxID=5016 RepID=M2UTL7_COCH5|nr:uncharacterized protein COCC4DRAFT_172524 [Bipolaris maydis ATCC 48331]EMD96901.1 hypothetical protein COCHEDRAFT_1150579 [Bipolaris maydis C5]ENI03770.1 hypothetical protein COCC4DRAFT_172524 [Bipolaris maydis ATCC 48331]KAJ6211532.1 hypothetical protein PSV09DRAFT_1150579 [Bipolaris maydis]